MTEPPKTPAAKYRRISDDREGRELGIARQDEDLDALAERGGYVYVASYCDNDIGASTRSNKPRDDYNQMLADARAGRFEVICAYTSSRLTRRPREHEAQIELAEQHGVRYDYVSSPSFDLNTAHGRQIARMLAAQDAAESEIISERVTRARLQRAQQGRNNGGRRPFGFDVDGITIRPSEAAEIVKAADDLLAGVSLNQVTLDLRKRGVPTVKGGKWITQTVKQILIRPRNAGLVVYKGEILEGAMMPGEPILKREVWEAVRALLLDPSRRTTPGNTPRWLGSGLYRCGHPDCIDVDPPNTMRVTGSATGRQSQRYRCEEEHLARAALVLDRFVLSVIAKRLARKDAVDLLTPSAPGVDVAALERDAAALRAKINEAGDLWEDGTLTAAEYRVRKARLESKLAEVVAQQRRSASRDPLDGLAGNPDAAQVLDRLDLGRKRAVLDALITVTVLPQKPGRMPDGSRFDPDRILIEPKLSN